MADFLTTSKIVLLLLVFVYTSDVVPPASGFHVLDFILEKVMPDLGSPGSDQDITPIADFRHHLSKYPSNLLGKSVWDLLLIRLWQANCESILHDFMANLRSLLTKSRRQLLRERDGEVPVTAGGRISPGSPLGTFIRLSFQDYHHRHFHSTNSLWQDFVAYRWPTRQEFERQHGDKFPHQIDENLHVFNLELSSPLTQFMFPSVLAHQELSNAYSRDDVDKLLDYQVSEMQAVGGRLSDDMRSRLASLSKQMSGAPKTAFYLKSVDRWRAGDYPGAFENIRRFFDYNIHPRERVFHQYALLNLAVIQADFDCHAAAMPALLEAIAVARAKSDHPCLNYCLGWFHHFARCNPLEMRNLRDNGVLGDEAEGLAFLETRARDSEMWTLLGSTMLSEAQLFMARGNSLAQVFALMAKACHVGLSDSQGGVTALAAPVLNLKGGLFERTGQTSMARLCREVFSQCHNLDRPYDEEVKCLCDLAHLLVQQGEYTEAEAVFQTVSKGVRRVLKHDKYISFWESALRAKRLLRHGDLKGARYLVEKLNAQTAPNMETAYHLKLLNVDMAIRSQKYNQAMKLVSQMMENAAPEKPDVVVPAKVMLLEARIWALCDHAAQGLTITKRAIRVAQRARTLPVLLEGIWCQAQIMCQLEQWNKARELIRSVLPLVHETSDYELIGRMLLILADVDMACAGARESGSPEQNEYLEKVLRVLDSALSRFSTIEDLELQMEVLNKKELVCRVMGCAEIATAVVAEKMRLQDPDLEMRQAEAKRVENTRQAESTKSKLKSPRKPAPR